MVVVVGFSIFECFQVWIDISFLKSFAKENAAKNLFFKVCLQFSKELLVLLFIKSHFIAKNTKFQISVPSFLTIRE